MVTGNVPVREVHHSFIPAAFTTAAVTFTWRDVNATSHVGVAPGNRLSDCPLVADIYYPASGSRAARGDTPPIVGRVPNETDDPDGGTFWTSFRFSST